MNKVIVIYGTTTGNTEEAAGLVKSSLERKGFQVNIADVANTGVGQVKDFDLVLLGCSTWGDGDLQDDFWGFYEKMDSANFSGKKTAVFGCGDSDMYPDTFCFAVDQIERKLNECGAELVADGLKIDGDVISSSEEIKSWAGKISIKGF